MTLLELSLIGVPEVILDGQPVTFARRGSLAVLAYLALSKRAYPRETLATLLAGDSSEDQARKYLSNVLVDLRQHVRGYIHATRQTVIFDRSLPCRIDVDLFRDRLAASGEQNGNADIESVIELYRGEFLAGLSLGGAPDYDVWLFAQREELRGAYMQALGAQIERSLRLGAWSSGIGPARRLIAEEPWLEEAHRQLMLMLAHCGQRRAAIAQYHACRRVLREELDVEPTPETTALFKRLRAAMSPPPHNLPTVSSPIIGRAQEKQLAMGLMTDPSCQLVTLTGMGGSGKTRLALEVAWAFASPTATPPEQPFADGIVFVSLTDTTETDAEIAQKTLLASLARAMGLPSDGCTREISSALAAHLKNSELLILIDNMEGVRAGASALEPLLKQAPHVKVLATSRAPLHLELERCLHVDGLGLPTTPADVEHAEASALFLQEARRVQVGFTLPESQRPYLVKMCRQLGGFPLALLLAARWAPVLPCSEIARELAGGVDVLASPEQDLPERHRSLRGILDSTFAQRTSEERALAQKLADISPEADSAADFNGSPTTTDMLAGLRVLNEQALVSVDKIHGTARLHPLLWRYVRGADRRTRGAARVA